jgi:hypothetical protein
MTVKRANTYLQSQGYYEKTDFTILSKINLPRIVYLDLLGVYWYQIINELQKSPQNHDPAFDSLLHTSFNQQSPNTQFIKSVLKNVLKDNPVPGSLKRVNKYQLFILNRLTKSKMTSTFEQRSRLVDYLITKG